MDRRHQVFVSSTFEDLREERSAVIGALLQIDCFPAGMELFPAADDDSWTLIKSVIDDSDFYLVILGGRYGSLGNDGKSYTHMEYEYACEQGKPTIALVHSNPGGLPADRSEKTENGRAKLETFRAQLKQKNCRLWADRAELSLAVVTGVQHLKKTRLAKGWVRGGGQDEPNLKDEVLQLRRELEEKRQALAEACARLAPVGTEDLAQGLDKTGLSIDVSTLEHQRYRNEFTVPWQVLFRAVLPHTFGAGARELALANAIVDACMSSAEYADPFNLKEGWNSPTLNRFDFGRIMNQMIALGLIQAVQTAPTVTRWKATPYGLEAGARMIAEKRA